MCASLPGEESAEWIKQCGKGFKSKRILDFSLAKGRLMVGFPERLWEQNDKI
jgi:hypothetical protein